MTGPDEVTGDLVAARELEQRWILFLRRGRRFVRERAAVQHEIDRLQERGGPSDEGAIDRLWEQKLTLSVEIERLSQGSNL